MMRISQLTFVSALGASTLLLFGCAQRQTSAPQATPPRIIPASDPVAINGDLLPLIRAEDRFELGIESEQRNAFPTARRQRATLFVSSASINQRGEHTAEILTRTALHSIQQIVVVEPDPLLFGAWEDLKLSLPDSLTITFFNREEMEEQLSSALERTQLILWDVPPSGFRDSDDLWALKHTLTHAAVRQIPFMVYDRPALLTTEFAEGPIPDEEAVTGGFVPLAVPDVLGLTSAELVRYLSGPQALQAPIRQSLLANWRRSDSNRWISNQPRTTIPALGQQRRAILTETGAFDQDILLLSRVGALLAPSERETMTLTTNPPMLRIPVSNEGTVRGRLTAVADMAGLDLALQSDEGGAHLRATPSSLLPIRPTEAALMIRMLISENPREFLAEDPAVIHHRATLQALGRGLTAEQARRRWVASGSYATFVDHRERMLLYEP